MDTEYIVCSRFLDKKVFQNSDGPRVTPWGWSFKGFKVRFNVFWIVGQMLTPAIYFLSTSWQKFSELSDFKVLLWDGHFRYVDNLHFFCVSHDDDSMRTQNIYFTPARFRKTIELLSYLYSSDWNYFQIQMKSSK